MDPVPDSQNMLCGGFIQNIINVCMSVCLHHNSSFFD